MVPNEFSCWSANIWTIIKWNCSDSYNYLIFVNNNARCLMLCSFWHHLYSTILLPLFILPSNNVSKSFTYSFLLSFSQESMISDSFNFYNKSKLKVEYVLIFIMISSYRLNWTELCTNIKSRAVCINCPFNLRLFVPFLIQPYNNKEQMYKK